MCSSTSQPCGPTEHCGSRPGASLPVTFGLERAQIGRSGVWLCGIVFDLSQSQGFELGDEFA